MDSRDSSFMKHLSSKSKEDKAGGLFKEGIPAWGFDYKICLHYSRCKHTGFAASHSLHAISFTRPLYIRGTDLFHKRHTSDSSCFCSHA